MPFASDSFDVGLVDFSIGRDIDIWFHNNIPTRFDAVMGKPLSTSTINNMPLATGNSIDEKPAIVPTIDDVIEISDNDDDTAPVKVEPNISGYGNVLKQQLAILQKENQNLRIHCEALQSRVLQQENTTFVPVITSTLNGYEADDDDKENSSE